MTPPRRAGPAPRPVGQLSRLPPDASGQVLQLLDVHLVDTNLGARRCCSPSPGAAPVLSTWLVGGAICP